MTVIALLTAIFTVRMAVLAVRMAIDARRMAIVRAWREFHTVENSGGAALMQKFRLMQKRSSQRKNQAGKRKGGELLNLAACFILNG